MIAEYSKAGSVVPLMECCGTRRRGSSHLFVSLFLGSGPLRMWAVMPQVTFQESSALTKLVVNKDLSYSSSGP